MISDPPPSTRALFEKRDDGHGGIILARHDGSLKQAERCDPTIELPASAIYKPKVHEPSSDHDSSHDGDLERVGCNSSESNNKSHVDQSQNQKANRPVLGYGYFEAWFGRQYGQWSICLFTTVAYANMGALAQGWTQALAMAPNASASAGAILGSWLRVLTMCAIITYADARALPPDYSSGGGQGSDTAVLSDTIGTSWSKWVTLSIIPVSVAGGVEAWVYFRRGRGRQIRVMVNVGVFTLVIAAVPMIFHQAGGIEAELNGPLWGLWAGAHINFVLRGALLLRNDQAGYLSPLGYVAVLAVLSHLVFFTADEPNSRLYTTLTTFAVTVLQDVGLRAFFGDAQVL